jgi:hypothetical protein
MPVVRDCLMSRLRWLAFARFHWLSNRRRARANTASTHAISAGDEAPNDPSHARIVGSFDIRLFCGCRARDVEATLKRLSGLAEKLMQISRVDAGAQSDWQRHQSRSLGRAHRRRGRGRRHSSDYQCGAGCSAQYSVGSKGPLYSGDTQSSGSGLGLAIVETIVTQTGGKLELPSPHSVTTAVLRRGQG